jgi:calcineurin-like phosphoesterase family protein
MKTFVTSDLHFFHENVIKFCNRPFGSVEHMNESLINNWNMVVGSNDHIYMLGDFSFGKVNETIDVLKRLNGIKHKITGNHDRKGSCQKLPWHEYFCAQHDYYRFKLNKKKYVMCHFPFSSWERGYVNLHGHWHSLSGYENKYMQYDVGVDANGYTPLLIEDAYERSLKGVKSEGKY